MKTLRKLVQGTRKLLTVDKHETVLAAAHALKEVDKSAILVTREGEVIGIVTDHDLFVRVICENRSPSNTKVHEIMTSPVYGIHIDTPLAAAAQVMAEQDIRHLVVHSDDGQLAMITARELLLDDLAEQRSKVNDLEHYVHRYR